MTTSQCDMGASKIKVLALLEPDVVTGAARNLIDFCEATREHALSRPNETQFETSVATFIRAKKPSGTSTDAPNEFVRNHSEGWLPPNQLVAALRNRGITVDLVPERFRFDPRVLSLLKRVVALRQPDVIVSYHVKSHFLVKMSALWKHHPWIAFHHGYTTTDLRMRAYNQLDRLSLPTAHRVLTVCEAFAQELIRTKGVGPDRLRVQHNSIRREENLAQDAGSRLRADLGIEPTEKVILAIGRFSREKAHRDLIEAVARMRHISQDMRLRLVLVGDGPERELMKRQVTELGISEVTVFVGQVTCPRPYYAAADVMALPSHSEGSPFVLLEAMAAKLPVVATAVGGVPEMVTSEKTALLVPASQPQQLAAALLRLLQDPEFSAELARNAYGLIATRYSAKTYFQNLSTVYLEAVGIR